MKYKKIDDDYFYVILDRLTRFEPAYIRFNRVFTDIINKYLISKPDYELTPLDKIDIVEQIVSNSIKEPPTSCKTSKILTLLEEKYFIPNKLSYQYLSARLNIDKILDKISTNSDSPKNLIWLKAIGESNLDLIELRKKDKLLYPIEKIILCEGETERILLNRCLNIFDIDLDEKGYYLLAAGGKNQVARKYYEMIEYTKLPFFVLLDKDGESTKDIIQSKLRAIDSIYILNSGEFEDLIPDKIIMNAINTYHNTDFNCNLSDFSTDIKNVSKIEAIYKKYGFGDYKKAEFARILNEYIVSTDISTLKTCFDNSEIKQIAKLLA